jgi:TetR/AcrR family transcriptional regulator
MLQPGKSRERQRAEIYESVLAAATTEFARMGFEAASLRTIATAAGVLQPQINYHFGSKLLLWQEAVDHLMAEIDVALAAVLTTHADARKVLSEAIRAFVQFSATRPDLHRMLIHESTAKSARLEWLVNTHIGPISDGLAALWLEVADMPHAATFPSHMTYHLLVGSALPYVCSAETELLAARRDRLGLPTWGAEETDPIERHIQALIRAYVPTTA